MRTEFEVGDSVRVDIPDESDPEHHLHGRHGKVSEVFEDDGNKLVGEDRDSKLYRVKFEGGAEIDFRWRDIRPPIEDEGCR